MRTRTVRRSSIKQPKPVRVTAKRVSKRATTVKSQSKVKHKQTTKQRRKTRPPKQQPKKELVRHLFQGKRVKRTNGSISQKAQEQRRRSQTPTRPQRNIHPVNRNRKGNNQITRPATKASVVQLPKLQIQPLKKRKSQEASVVRRPAETPKAAQVRTEILTPKLNKNVIQTAIRRHAEVKTDVVPIESAPRVPKPLLHNYPQVVDEALISQFSCATRALTPEWVLVKKVGTGASGTVYQACNTTQEKNACEYVVKLQMGLKELQSNNEFKSEATINEYLGKLGLAPKVYAFGACEKTRPDDWEVQYIVMQRLSGPSMYEKPGSTWTAEDIDMMLDLYYKILDETGIAHNDNHFSNYMFDNGKLYLIDFGRARMSQTSKFSEMLSAVLYWKHYLPFKIFQRFEPTLITERTNDHLTEKQDKYFELQLAMFRWLQRHFPTEFKTFFNKEWLSYHSPLFYNVDLLRGEQYDRLFELLNHKPLHPNEIGMFECAVRALASKWEFGNFIGAGRGGKVWQACLTTAEKERRCDYAIKIAWVRNRESWEGPSKYPSEGVIMKEAGDLGFAPKVYDFGACETVPPLAGKHVEYIVMQRLSGPAMNEKPGRQWTTEDIDRMLEMHYDLFDKTGIYTTKKTFSMYMYDNQKLYLIDFEEAGQPSSHHSSEDKFSVMSSVIVSDWSHFLPRQIFVHFLSANTEKVSEHLHEKQDKLWELELAAFRWLKRHFPEEFRMQFTEEWLWRTYDRLPGVPLLRPDQQKLLFQLLQDKPTVSRFQRLKQRFLG